MRSGERLNVLDTKICARRGLAVSVRKQYAEYKRAAGILSRRACADTGGTPVLPHDEPGQDPSVSNGILGLCMGGCAALLGCFMLWRGSRLRQQEENK